MRFAIAAGILAHTLPASSEMENGVILSQAERRLQIQDILQEPPSSGRGTSKKTYKNGDGGSLFSSFGFQGRREGLLKNKMKSFVECDPTASGADADADLGVLSCGMGQYCMESKSSELGGACVDSSVEVDRELQQEDDGEYDEYDGFGFGFFCNATFAAYNPDVDCDCGEFNTTTNIGTIECLSAGYCYSDIGCNSTCATIDFELVAYPDGNYSINYCNNFFSPYEQQVCFAGVYGVLVDEGASCSLSFNEVECDSCFMSSYSNDYSITLDNSTFNVTISGVCREFDCTNTAGGHSGNTCEDGDESISPIIGACLDPSLLPAPETPAPTPAPVPVVSPAPVEGSMAPSTEDPEKTTAPTMESGVPGILSTKGVMSLFGLSMAIFAYFAG